VVKKCEKSLQKDSIKIIDTIEISKKYGKNKKDNQN